MIPVTKSYLPPLNEYTSYVKKAYDNQWLTNRGSLALDLEKKLSEILHVESILITCNGTIPLQIAVKLLGNSGEIITTPFSYVATTASIVWESCTPVFVDIHPEYLTIDETKIEQAITPNTTCILATHVFGNPCNIQVIDQIAKKYNLKIIYDAAHCFGVQYQDQSIFCYGDISTCSFHATKLFHMGEGGAAFISDEQLRHKFYYSHNFGHNGSLEFYGLGINGKISELQAAMGLAVLPYLPEILAARKKIVSLYNEYIDFTNITKLRLRDNTKWNYSYYPIIFENEEKLLAKLNQLNTENIFPRRYFYPSLDCLPYVKTHPMPISRSISSRILCLPLYHGLDDDKVLHICNIINS
jgi:dTDP-4-amino-4,6-dideoxygalactose transaminase